MDGSMSIELAAIRGGSHLAREYPESFVSLDGAALWLESAGGDKRLAVLAPPGHHVLSTFDGVGEPSPTGHALLLCALSMTNAAGLRETLPWLRPVPLGLTTSAGFGDRLGLATPGHARALMAVLAEASGQTIAPIFAQQSIREMKRTARTPSAVLDDATWGAFQAGWRLPLGADADHLKTAEDIDATSRHGYSFYTLDPSAYVAGEADTESGEEVRRRLDALPWAELESDPADVQKRYGDRVVALDDRAITIDADSAARAAVKYGGAIAHVLRLYRHLLGKGIEFDLEVSVDETETPTSHAEHVYIASELQRLGVRFVSLAPRFVGRFEKGVDYIGDLQALRADLDGHAAIARSLGPYKLSLHSGSDKFSVYPVMHDAAQGLVHLKTAGTSYLEALRVTAQVDPALFRAILDCARAHYPEDRATYHVSAELDRVPAPSTVPDERLPDLLNAFDARQVLHVTFGTALARFGPELLTLLRAHESAYDEALQSHFTRHLAPFVQPVHASTATNGDG